MQKLEAESVYSLYRMYFNPTLMIFSLFLKKIIKIEKKLSNGTLGR
tara:strand:- start:79 stop:216 length:138 start_codon:yes stop_codon:yes gene_type:complete